MPIRTCKCGHPYYLHAGAGFTNNAGKCGGTNRNKKKERVPCDCESYDHDPASGPLG